jgi:hypothetical protein
MSGSCAHEELYIDEPFKRPTLGITQESVGDFNSISDIMKEGCALRELAPNVVSWMAVGTMSCLRYQQIWDTRKFVDVLEGIQAPRPMDIVPQFKSYQTKSSLSSS